MDFAIAYKVEFKLMAKLEAKFENEVECCSPSLGLTTMARACKGAG
jgi:hypothetical protein